MAWNSNVDPITYLERRLKYYKRQYNSFPRTYKKSQFLQSKYSESDVLDILENTQRRIKEYELAIEQLMETGIWEPIKIEDNGKDSLGH